MPDRSRYPWLPRENVVDPTIFDQLDPKKKLPTPDDLTPPIDPRSADQITTSTKSTPAGGPGGSVAGWLPPSPFPPKPPGDGPVVIPPPTGGKAAPEPGQFPTVHIGPVDSPPKPTPMPTGPAVNIGPIGSTPGGPALPPGPTIHIGPIDTPPSPSLPKPTPTPLPPGPTLNIGPVGSTPVPSPSPSPTPVAMPPGPKITSTFGNGGGNGGVGGGPDNGGVPDRGTPTIPTFPDGIPPTPTPSDPNLNTSTITYGDIVPDDVGDGGPDEDNQKDDEGYEEMAKGGIIVRPTRVKVAESGPEAIIPVGPRMKYQWRGAK